MWCAAARGAQQDAAADDTEGAGEGLRREVASVHWMERYTLVRRERRAFWKGTLERYTLAVHASAQGAAR